PEQRDDLRTLEDVQEGMVLEGTVTNVAAFGAFVDIGVHQDGLVHVSQLASRFVKDPAEVVKVGDRVKVRVLSVDLARKRLALSIRAVTEGGAGRAPQGQTRSQGRSAPRASGGQGPKRPPLAAEPFNNPFARLRRSGRGNHCCDPGERREPRSVACPTVDAAAKGCGRSSAGTEEELHGGESAGPIYSGHVSARSPQ